MQSDPTPAPAAATDVEELLNVPFTFDPSRCNHMGKAAIDCPHCLRHRIGDLELAVAELAKAGYATGKKLVACEAERDALRAAVEKLTRDGHCTCDDYMSTPAGEKCYHCQAVAALSPAAGKGGDAGEKTQK